MQSAYNRFWVVTTKKKSNSQLSDVTPFKGKQQQSYIL